ncbi:hypothetical protein [Rhodoligotrophos defluvii]|uniref:hypothetical protein n=1 Tax=Rhodoligotrophos defluvii TaxID=2561934 RepID=UPI0010C9FF10|nr:hypothetical protein [Rhodoligotrophos defluvii]
MKRALLALAVSGSLMALGGSASAAAIAAGPAAVSAHQQALVQPVAQKKVVVKKRYKNGKVVTKRKVVYSRERFGPRYRYKRPGYTHYYGGYWYRTPWWTIGIPGGPTIAVRPY